MTIFQVAKHPTTAQPRAGGIHESIFRSYQTLALVKEYLRRGVPADVILEIIESIEAEPGSDA